MIDELAHGNTVSAMSLNPGGRFSNAPDNEIKHGKSGILSLGISLFSSCLLIGECED